MWMIIVYMTSPSEVLHHCVVHTVNYCHIASGKTFLKHLVTQHDPELFKHLICVYD